MKTFSRFAGGLAACSAFATLAFASAPSVQAIPDQTINLSPDSHFLTPAPPYPFLVYGDSHQWTAQVVFNERGDATEAVMIRSSGSGQLDDTITHWIKARWKSRVGKPATLVTSAK